MKLDRCTALITGASAGIGAEIARQLGGRAQTLILVARREDRLAELRAEITAQHQDTTVLTHAADLNERRQITSLIDFLASKNLTVDFLVNNAGLGDRGTFEESDPARIDSMLQVNIVALTQLTRHLLPPMVQRRHGAILSVSSSASFLPMPGLAVYAATKAYVTSFSEAIGMELRSTGVTVTALCPGPVHTEFDAVARRSSNSDERVAPEITYVPVETVVRDALAAVENNTPIVIPGLVMKIGMSIVRMAPLPLLRLAARLSPVRR